MSVLGSRTNYKPFLYEWAYTGYTKQKQMHWIPEEVSLREDIQDWNKKLTKEEKNLLTQLFRFFTTADCYHPDTEILTMSGWLNISEWETGISVAQFDSKANITFAEPLHKIVKPYKGVLHHIQDGNNKTEQAVTDGHKVVYWYNGDFRASEAKSFLPYQGVTLKTSGTKDGLLTCITPLEALWIAFQADGNVKKDVNGSKLGYIPHRFAFKKKRKSDRLKEILKQCDIPYDFTTSDDYYQFVVKYPSGLMSKDFSWIDLGNVSTSYARSFLDELAYWDSHIDKNGYVSYTNTNKAAVDIAQVMAVLADIHHSYKVNVDTRSSKFSDTYKLNYQAGKLGDVDGQSLRRNSVKSVYDGLVYCLTMPQGTIITRYNNRVAFSGNCDVAQGYIQKFMPWFGGHPELAMMMSTFAAMESVHIESYALLLDTVGMPEVEYSAFSKYKEMAAKHDYVSNITNLDTIEGKAKALAIYSAFTEGMQLFSSFAILLNFTRFGKMKGMGKIVTFSIKDESLHCEYMVKVFRQLIQENMNIWTDEFKKELYDVAREMVKLEDAFIDLVFEQGGVEGITSDEVKQYIRYIADRRLLQLGLKTEFKVKKNPLPWLDEILNAPEHASFFETRVSEYQKGALKGDWNKVFKIKKGTS